MIAHVKFLKVARVVAGGVAFAAALSACGSKCPQAKSALDDVKVASEDVARVNRLVEKRKAAMAEVAAGGQGTLVIQNLRFSVTGYELAVENQLRLLKISPKFDNSPLYREYRGVFDAMRCDFDALVAEPEEHRLSDADGHAVQEWSKRLRAILRKEGQLSQGELKGYLEEGIRDNGDGE
jgi:hypothetical protein